MARRRRYDDEDDEDDEEFFYDRFGHRRRRRRRPKPPPPKPLWLRALGCLALGYVLWMALIILAGLVSLVVLWSQGFFDNIGEPWKGAGKLR